MEQKHNPLETSVTLEQGHSLSQQIDQLAVQSNLTISQLLLWLGQKLNPGVPLYNMVFSFTLNGEIEVGRFQQAFQTLVNHCDVLRLTIVERETVPQQQVSPVLDYLLPLLDVSSEADPHNVAQKWMEQRCQTPLELTTCLFDAALLKLSSDQFIFYLNQHHLIADNWSFSLIYRYLQTLYTRTLNPALTPAPIIPAYLQYAEQERVLETTPWTQQAITHWQQQTFPAPVPLYGQISGTRVTPSGPARSERTYFELGTDRSQALRALATSPAARSLSIHQSQFNLFLTLLFAYLYRISGSTELAIAAPAHNRPTPDLKETPGVFIELFPLQATISPAETFVSLLEKVKRETLAFLRYAQAGTSHHAISRSLNVVLSYINVTFPDFDDGIPTHTHWLHAGYGDDQHHLRLEVHDFDATGNFTLQFDFNRDLISDLQRQWASTHFCKLLDAWLEDGQQFIAAVDILADAERALILAPSAQGLTLTAPNATLVDHFQQQVTAAPDRLAVVGPDADGLTYAELEAQSNQLAHYLRTQGLSTGAVVGLCLDRSTAMVVSILAVLKAGAAYLPLLPEDPAERLAFIVTDAQVSMVLTQADFIDKLPKTIPHLISLDTHRAAIALAPSPSPEIPISAQDLAYILYTSGSTGQPKGVMVEHRNVLALLQGFEQTAPAEETLQGTAVCPYGFDVSVWEIFSNLCFGGTVHLLSKDILIDPLQFARYLITHAITSAYIPPALLLAVITALESEVLEKSQADEKRIALNRILVGVEPIQQGVLQRYQALVPPIRIVNGYGPTETTICATFYRLDQWNQVIDSTANTPIGKAVPGYEVYLVNPHHQLVPIGVKGEIVIGGAGLSRGYLNRPELMAQQWINHPFGPGQLYRTGDQAQYRTDGNLDFLGRLDHQVKIRGFRVELSEVETALNQVSWIQQAAVVAQETAQGNKVLVAYVSTSPCSDRSHPLTPAMVRDALKPKLPDYMVPSQFVILETLPLTTSGKIDRLGLVSGDSKASGGYEPQIRLDHETDATLSETDAVEDKTPGERILSDLWKQLLQVEQVGIHDNFFDLGGDSIMALQIAARATEAGLTISPLQVLQHPTIASVLTQINPEVPIPIPTSVPGSIPLTPIQQSFFEQTLPDPDHWNQTLLLEVSHPLDVELFAIALEQLRQHHPILGCRFTEHQGLWQAEQPASQSPSIMQPTVQSIDLSHQSISEQDRAMAALEAECNRSLSLSEGDLVRVVLFDLGPQRPNHLLLIIHHLVVDGVSWFVLLDDLERCYRAAQSNTPVLLRRTTPFKVWATGLQTLLSTDTFQSELNYWMRPELLAAVSGPTPRETQENTSLTNTVAASRTVSTYLTVEQTHTLLKEVPQISQAQVNEVLLAALTLSFVHTNTPSLLIDIESHGREESMVPDATLTRSVGWFTTTFPLVLSRSTSPELGQHIQLVKAQLRAVPHQGIGYGLLRYRAEPAIQSQLKNLPQAQILFNYLGDLERLLPADSMFRFARELRLSRGAQGQRQYWLEINAAIVKGQLRVDWIYTPSIHPQSVVDGWANWMMTGLAGYLNQIAQPADKVSMRNDFPLVNLNHQKLDKIAALLNQSNHP